MYGETEEVKGIDRRRYYLCCNCYLIFVDRSFHLPPEEEKKRYDTHNNSIDDQGYVSFLNRLIEPMLPYLDLSMRGLDYGCGPGPTLSKILEGEGIECENYDPFFLDRPLVPPYDFIFATECFEHFHYPGKEIGQICSLLRNGDYLGVMTELWTDLDDFADWYYLKNSTHVSFFHKKTLKFLKSKFGLDLLQSDDRRVALFKLIT